MGTTASHPNVSKRSITNEGSGRRRHSSLLLFRPRRISTTPTLSAESDYHIGSRLSTAESLTRRAAANGPRVNSITQSQVEIVNIQRVEAKMLPAAKMDQPCPPTILSDGRTSPTPSSDSKPRLLHHQSKQRNIRTHLLMSEEVRGDIELARRNLASRKPWIDGLYVMQMVVANTITSIAIAWFVTFLFAIGAPFAAVFPSSAPRKHSSEYFSPAIGIYFVFVVCFGHAVVKSFQESERIVSISLSAPRLSFTQTLLKRLRATSCAMFFAMLVGGGIMELLAWFHVPFHTYGRLHLYVLGLLSFGYVNYADQTAKRHRRRSVERLMSQKSMQSQLSARASFATSDDTIGGPNVTAIVPNRVSSVPTVMATRIKGRDRLVAFLSLNAGFAYLHLSAALNLTHQWQVFLYAAFSLALKIAIQEATKKYQLHAARMPSARIAHLAMSIPTLTIDAQIRMVIMQKAMHSSMQATSIVQGSAFTVLLCEVIFRVVKVYRLRYVIRSRLTKSMGMKRILHRVNSKIAARDVTVARAEYAQFLNWKNYMLRVHAAEVYADMHGEYISIGMASAIVFFMHQHPCYRIDAEGESVKRQMLGALFQIGTGLVFDYISSVFEGVHEVPLYESISDEGKGLRTFMHVLLGALTAGNVGVVVTFALQQCGGE